nr:glycosyltransferase family 2 protein [uncultured Undibacterium sp.]
MEYLSVAPPRLEFGLCRRNLQPRISISPEIENATVIIGIAIHNQRVFIRNSLISALSQTINGGSLAVIILDDCSTDCWEEEVDDLLLDLRVLVIDGVCGSPSHSRNAILDFVDQQLSRVKWVARLDADDLLDNALSVNALISAAEVANASYAIGSNYLVVDGMILPDPNIANSDLLLNKDNLADFIESFCTGKSKHELPSCNLLMRTGFGFRYPLLKSAEDHWLVASLLMFHADKAAIVSEPIYCRYSLSGMETDVNRAQGKWQLARDQLRYAARQWQQSISNTSISILGYGQEGIVVEKDHFVFKHFYTSAITGDMILQIQNRAVSCPARFPQFEFYVDGTSDVTVCYPRQFFFELSERLELSEIKNFLLDLFASRVVVTNVKRENLRLDERRRLVYIDIGKDIVDFSPSGFLECAAKLYAVAYLLLGDHELAMRRSFDRQENQLKSLDGFEDFYADLIQACYPHCVLECQNGNLKRVNRDVTLLIKACAQDAGSLIVQVRHIVGNLSCDRQFGKVVLLLDSYKGPFLRQYCGGDFDSLMSNSQTLLAEGWIDQVMVAPSESGVIEITYQSWFGIDGVYSSHTSIGAPLFAQLWAFDQIDTPFVLQCDVDIFVGRKDINHDYLQDMISAIAAPEVWSVGFNIPKSETGFNRYHSTEFGYVPEVRFALLDLQKIRKAFPLPNQVEDCKLKLMWHRAMEFRQRDGFYKSLRGGDHRTFYLHIQNNDKPRIDGSMLRDLIGQGIYPSEQVEKWDLNAELNWVYPKRSERIVFLMKGRNTSPIKIQRALKSLSIQSDQDFGLIYIDDASDGDFSFEIMKLLAPFRDRLTLIRREVKVGYIPNFQIAVNDVCVREDTLVAVLDQDDALMSNQVVSLLKSARQNGVDLINGKMFRPNKPIRSYVPDYVNSRSKGGANVWAHMRAFTKQLFSEVPEIEFQNDGKWYEELTDFVTMIPMAERAKYPLYIDSDYFYWHERDDYPSHKKQHQEKLKEELLSRISRDLPSCGS